MYTSVEVQEPVRLKSIYSFFHNYYSADYSFRGEIHDFWEVVCVLEGKICVTAGEQIYDLSGGELIVHKPMEFHSFFVNDKEGAEVAIFSFSAQTVLEEALSQKVFSLNDFQLGIVSRMFDYLDGRREHNEEYRQRWSMVDVTSSAAWFRPYMCLFEVDSHASVMASAFLSQLLFTLAESEGRKRENSSGDAKLFRNAMDYLSIHVHKNICVEELARAIGMSRSGLNRLFRKYAGVSVHRYCLMQRIKTATEYLQAGLGVTQTSQRLGFSNQSYFSACYKRETGINPSEVVKK